MRSVKAAYVWWQRRDAMRHASCGDRLQHHAGSGYSRGELSAEVERCARTLTQGAVMKTSESMYECVSHGEGGVCVQALNDAGLQAQAARFSVVPTDGVAPALAPQAESGGVNMPGSPSYVRASSGKGSSASNAGMGVALKAPGSRCLATLCDCSEVSAYGALGTSGAITVLLGCHRAGAQQHVESLPSRRAVPLAGLLL